MEVHSLASVLGYDVEVQLQLEAADRDGLDWISGGWLLSCTALALPIAHLAWLASHDLLLATATSGATFALVLAVLRLIVAGGGAAPSEDARTKHPYLGPTLLIAALAALFGQPAQLPLLRAELEPHVAQRRHELSAAHDISAARLATSDQSPAAAAYRAQLAQCEFVGLRLLRVWSKPARAFRYTLFYVGLVLLPAVLASTVSRGSVRRYQQRRNETARRVIRAHTRAAREQIAQLLAQYPSYVASANHVPDPFGTCEPDPLRQPWPSTRPPSSAT